MKRILSLSLLSLGLSACGLISRHPHSGYYDDYGFRPTAAQEFYSDRARYERTQVKEELGIDSTRSLTETEAQQLVERLTLKRLEEGLESSREKRQYYTYKPYFKNDAQRIAFLHLPSLEARERFAQANDITTEEDEYNKPIADAIEKSDITVGMTKKAVTESWGDPDLIEIAGNPLYGNERWKYNKMVSTSNGYDRELRIIYFEAGRVVGWESL